MNTATQNPLPNVVCVLIFMIHLNARVGTGQTNYPVSAKRLQASEFDLLRSDTRLCHVVTGPGRQRDKTRRSAALRRGEAIG